MANPPSYEESVGEYASQNDSKQHSKTPQHFSIREEVGVSRSQHIAALVEKLVPKVRNRARQGLSKSTLLLLPSNQQSCRKGQLVGFPEDELPTLIQLEGCYDTLEFWTQREVLDLLQSQILAATSETGTSQPEAEALPERSNPSKSSFFSRKQAKASDLKPNKREVEPSVTVEVQLDEAHFRSENAYGLYETLRAKCVLVTINIR